MTALIQLEIEYENLDAATALELFLSEFRAGKTMQFYITADDGETIAFAIEDAKFAQTFRLRQPKREADFILN